MELERPKKKRTRKKKKRWPILLLLAIAAVVAVLMSPVCNIKEVSIVGNERVSTQQILDAVGTLEGQNLFRISTDKIERNAEGVPYVGEVSVHRVFPNKLRIEVKEEHTALFIPFAGKMICVGETGKVIDYISEDNAVGAPIAVGLTVEDYQIGESAKVKEGKALEVALSYSGYFKEYDLFPMVTELDVSNPEDVKFTIHYHLQVEFGKEEQLGYKMRYLKQVISEVGDHADGVINIRSVDHVTYRELTEEDTRTTPPPEEAANGEVATEAPNTATAEPTMVPEPE